MKTESHATFELRLVNDGHNPGAMVSLVYQTDNRTTGPGTWLVVSAGMACTSCLAKDESEVRTDIHEVTSFPSMLAAEAHYNTIVAEIQASYDEAVEELKNHEDRGLAQFLGPELSSIIDQLIRASDPRNN